MKKILKITKMLLVLCMSFFFLSCDNEEQKEEASNLIHAKWIYKKSITSSTFNSGGSSNSTINLNPNSYFQINKDNTYEAKITGGSGSGTVTINGQSQTINPTIEPSEAVGTVYLEPNKITFYSATDLVTYDIIELTANTLKLKYIFEDATASTTNIKEFTRE